MPDLRNMSMAGLMTLFATFSTFSPLDIKGALNTLTSAALAKGNGSFSIQTDAFSLQSKTLSAEPLVLPRLTLPPLGLPPGSFASTIQWNTNPYDSSSNPVVSVSALAQDAKEISITSLTTPFTTKWSINTQEYTFLCDQGIVLLRTGSSYQSAPNVTQLSPSTWSVPCGSFFRNVTCPVQSYSCPTADCVYWNTSLSAWKSDGCVKEVAGSNILCHCTHMTDFSVRLQSVSDDISSVFAHADKVYSEDGLVLYSKWYGLFGSIALCTIGFVALTTWLDIPVRKVYVDILMKHPKMKLLLQRTPLTPLFRFNRCSSFQLYHEVNPVIIPPKPRLNLCKRICVQHSYLQTLIRFDPRLSRSFRILFLILMQVHSLFVTALLYGFSFGSKKGLSISETIVLSIITSLVTIPCMRGFLYYLNVVGLLEFKHLFPLLYDEYMRRVAFEEIAQPLFSSPAQGAGGGDEERAIAEGVDAEESFLLRVLGWMIPQKVETVAEPVVVDRPAILKELAKSVSKDYPKFSTHSILWDLLPCHTLQGWLFLLSSFGWIGWCLQYLLLFAASHSAEVGDGILISYGSSELVTLFLTQPLAILLTTGAFILVHKYKGKLPWPISLLGSVETRNAIPSMYFFSNPLNHHTYTILSSEFAHMLFLEAPSMASGIDLFSAAPIKSILSSVNEEEEVVDRRMEELYTSMVTYRTRQG